MIYTDMESLVLAAMQCDASDTESLKRFGRYAKAYWDAYNNPPQGVIGVGAITYAQNALIAAQLNEGE